MLPEWPVPVLPVLQPQALLPSALRYWAVSLLSRHSLLQGLPFRQRDLHRHRHTAVQQSWQEPEVVKSVVLNSSSSCFLSAAPNTADSPSCERSNPQRSRIVTDVSDIGTLVFCIVTLFDTILQPLPTLTYINSVPRCFCRSISSSLLHTAMS